MRPSEALARHRSEVLEIIGRYPVANPRIFGSVARGEDTEESDVDILVDAQDTLSLFDLARLEIELERLLGVPTGVHTAGDSGLRHRAGSSQINAGCDGPDAKAAG